MTLFKPTHTAQPTRTGHQRPAVGRGRRLAVFPLLLLIVVLSGGPAAAAEKSEDGLMAADRAFAQATAKDRLDGWMHFFADDAVKFVFKGPLVRGKAAVRAADAPQFENTAVSLVWEPTDAGLFADGNTGFTRGDYRVVQKGDSGGETILSSGTYLTMWRHEDNGWKVILDTGVPDEAGDEGHAEHTERDPGDH
jgi:ketosteroid isomerase-like protein